MDHSTRLSKRPSLGYLKAITKKKSFMLFANSANILNSDLPEDQRSPPPPKPSKVPQQPQLPHKTSFYHSAIVDTTNREDGEPIRRSISLQHHSPDHQTYGKEGPLPCSLLLHEKYHHLKKMKKVGKGGSATIYLLTRLPTFTEFFQTPLFRKNHTVPYTVLAIKRHHRRNPNEESQLTFEKRLRQEFIITKTLQHSSHVITVFELLKDRRGRWCTVMDYCGGGDVLTLLHQVDLTSEAMDCVFKQLIRGLGDLHEQGVVHRDIKPDNLLMTQAGVLKITDFGVAQQGVMCQGLCGSTPYWPPELFTTLEYDGRAMDVWSAAITFYCLLYRQIPFLQANLQDPQYATFLKQRPEWWALSQCPADLQGVISAMLHPDPTQRWHISHCLASSWVQSIDVCYEHPHHHHHHHL